MTLHLNSSIRDFDLDKDFESLEYLYPEFAHNSNLENYSFFDYLKSLLKLIEENSVIVYTVIDGKTNEIMGFMFGEEIFPYIINVHIIVKKDYRNIYNTIKSCKRGIDKLKELEFKQLVASIDSSNKNAFLLLRMLGFQYIGNRQDQAVFWLMIS